MSSSKNIVTTKVIFSFFKLWTATPYEPGDDPKFTIALLFNKSDTNGIALLKKNYDEVLNADFDGALPYGAKPGYLVDGLIRYPQDPFYADKFILQCSQSADRPPQILDGSRMPIIERSGAHSGCEGHALISFYGYQGGSKGISASIHGVMVTGKALDLGGGSVDAAAAFGAEFGDIPQQADTPPQQADTPPVNQDPEMTEKAKGISYQAHLDSGWTHQGLLDNGYIK